MDICFVADENYAPYMATVIYSILKNNKNMDCFNFYIFDNGILEKTKKNLLKIVDEKVSIKFINCLPFEKNLNELNQIAEHITKTSYLKFVIADTLNHLDKVLYLDCDLVVMSDLEELWRYELENNLLAAVEDVGYTYWSKSNEELKLKFKCINSGVMLINCNLWRKEKLFKKFMKCAKKHEVVGYGQDQPVLNYVCKNRILYLPFIWNVQDTFFRRGIEIQNRTDIQECDFARINPAIIHYAYIEKPWNNINIFNAIYFWKYYKDTPWGNNKGECIYKKLQASYPYYRNIEYPFTLSVRTKNACISGWNLPEPEGT